MPLLHSHTVTQTPHRVSLFLLRAGRGRRKKIRGGAGSKIPAGAGQQLNSGPFRGRAGRGLHAWYSPISESQRLYKFCQIVSSESFSNKTMMHRWCQWDKFAKLAPVQAIDHILAPASSVGSHLHSDTHKRTKTFLQTATVVTIANWRGFER